MSPTWSSRKCVVALVHVEQDSVRQHFDSLREVGDEVAARHRGLGVEPQLDNFARRVVRDEIARRTLGHDGAMIHHHESIAELLGLVHVVGRDDERDAFSLQAVETFPEQVPGLGVEPGGRLVEDQEFRLVDEGSGNGEAAFHAAGKVVDPVVRPLGELREFEKFGRTLAKIRRAESRSNDRTSQDFVVRRARARACPPAARRLGVHESRDRPLAGRVREW